MTSFSFTSGDPSKLVANQNASMADIQGPFTDLRTFLNGGTMDETNVPNLAAAFTTYERQERAVAAAQAPAAGTYLMSLGNVFAANGALNTANAPTWASLMYLDPTIHAANSRTTKLNLRVFGVVNPVGPAVTFTFGLYPVLGFGGTAPATTFIASVGTVVAGSTVAFVAPAAGSAPNNTSGDFNFPAAGVYALAYVVSGGSAVASSAVDWVAQLEMRQV